MNDWRPGGGGMTEINKEQLKGNAALLVLSQLRKSEMYGYELIKAIEKESKNAFSLKEGSLYPILHQLELDGSITARWEDTDSARKRKYYRITKKGEKVLSKKKEEWILFRSLIDQFLLGVNAKYE